MKKSDKTVLTKERILNAAIIEFGTKGYDAAKINNICSENSIPKGLIYHNYKNKDDVYLHCVEAVFRTYIGYMQENGAEEGLHAYMELRCSFFSGNPDRGRIFFEAVLRPPAHLAIIIKGLRLDLDQFNLNIYRREIGRMTLRDGVTEQEAVEYYSIMQEMFNGYYGMSAEKDFTDIVAAHENKLGRMLDFMLYGIVKKG